MQPAQTIPAQPGRFSIGAVLERSFTVFRKKPFLFCGLTCLVIPVTVALTPVVRLIPENYAWAGGLLTLFLLVACLQVSQGAVVYAIYRILQNIPVSFGNAVSRGLARTLPLLGVTVLTGLGTRLGLLLLIVPGLILTCMWAVTIPVCMVERMGAVESMGRSAELTAGHRWRIFALSIIISFAPAAAAVLSTPIARLFPGGPSPLIFAMLFILLQTFTSIMTGVMYHDLRSAKEGASLNAFAQVFD